MRSQKKATAAARAEWTQRVKDCLVLRFESGAMKSYPTIAMRDQAIDEAHAAGVSVTIV
jgi:hypothetical protein